MKNKTIFLLFFLVFSLYKSANIYAADDKQWNGYTRENKINLNYTQYNNDKKDKIDEEWEVVQNNSETQDNKNEEDDIILSIKAFGNTAISVLGGMVLNIVERTLQQKADQFTAGMMRGSNHIGNAYGQGLAVRSAYEYEKRGLKEKNNS